MQKYWELVFGPNLYDLKGDHTFVCRLVLVTLSTTDLNSVTSSPTIAKDQVCNRLVIAS